FRDGTADEGLEVIAELHDLALLRRRELRPHRPGLRGLPTGGGRQQHRDGEDDSALRHAVVLRNSVIAGYIILHGCAATRCSTSSTTSPALPATSSCTTTDSGRERSATRKWDATPAASRPGCTRPGSSRATRSSSSARTARNGSSRSGAACSAASSWSRSTT